MADGDTTVGSNPYQAFRSSGNLQVFRPQLDELSRLHRQWLSDLGAFKESLRTHGAEPKVLEYVNEAFGRLAERNQAACWVTGKVADGNFGGLWFNPLVVMPWFSWVAAAGVAGCARRFPHGARRRSSVP